MKRLLKKKQKGGTLTGVPNKQLDAITANVKSFYNQYINSPEYKKRLIKQGYTNTEQTIRDRNYLRKTIKVIDNPNLVSQYHPDKQIVTVNRNELNDIGFPLESSTAHEIAHGIGSLENKNGNQTLNAREALEFTKRNKLTPLTTADMRGLSTDDFLAVHHDRKASESKADMDALRYKLYKDKIYNTAEKPFTQEYLNKAKKQYGKDGPIKRLFKNFKDSDLIYLMNNIAYNPDETIIPTAQKGGSINMRGMLNTSQDSRQESTNVGDQMRRSVDAYPNQETADYYNKLGANYVDGAGRFSAVRKATGNAAVTTKPDFVRKYMGAAGGFNPFTNTASVPAIDAEDPEGSQHILYEELAHAKQAQDKGVASMTAQWFMNDLPAHIKQKYLRLNKETFNMTKEEFAAWRGASPYNTKGAVENEAHKIISPMLKEKYKKGGAVTNTGYLPDSPDRHNDFNIIPGNQITMKGVKKKLVGIDNLGNKQIMVPGAEYVFPGDFVMEIPVKQQGGTVINDAEQGPVGYYKDEKVLRMMDGLNYSIMNGGNPMNHNNGITMFRAIADEHGQQAAQQMISDLILFDQDKNNKALKGDDRLRRFYDSYKNDVTARLKSIGYGPESVYQTTHDLDSKQQQMAKKQIGGPLNTQDRAHWNAYIDYLEKKGYKGSKELDSRDTNLSKKLFDEFSKGQYNYDEFIPRVQTDISSYRQQAIDMIKSGKAEFNGDLNKIEEVFMPGLSNVDAWAGSRTTSWKFPNEKVPVTEAVTGRHVKDMNNMVYSKINKKQLGGAAYEMPWDKFNRPDVKIPYRLPSAPFEWGDPNAAAPQGLDKPINPMTAEQKFAQQMQQSQQVIESGQQDLSNNAPRGSKIKNFLNKITPGNMASGLIEEYANPYSLTNTTSNLAGVATYFDNKRKAKDNDNYMRSQMSADNVFGVDNREDRGDYVNTGTSYGMFRPDQMGAKSPDGMYNGKFYNSMAEGGYIPDEISNPGILGNTSTREMVGDMMIPEFAATASVAAPAVPVNAFNFPTREVNVNVNDSTKQAYNYYVKDKQLPAHIAAGIVGNLFQESGLKPGAVEKTNTANGRGIAQWDVRDRWQGLLSWASKQGRDPYDLKTQLDYVLVEPGESGKAMSKLKNSRTPEEAAVIFGKLYERPSEKHANWSRRTSVASKLYNNQFKEGGEYEMSADQIAELRAQGYDIEEL